MAPRAMEPHRLRLGSLAGVTLSLTLSVVIRALLSYCRLSPHHGDDFFFILYLSIGRLSLLSLTRTVSVFNPPQLDTCEAET